MTQPGERPLITFLVFTYQHAKFIRETLESAFAQTYSPLEIVVSDDASTDGSWDLIREAAAAYRGPHQIVLNRNERNLGIGAHLNRCFRMCRGEIIVQADGDDVSLPQRTQEMYEAWERSGRRATLVYSAYRMTAEDGTPISDERHLLPQHQDTADLSAFCRELSVIGATSSAYHRTVIDRFGPVVDELAYWDRVSPFRAAMLGTIVFVPEILVLYRRHSGSIVSKVFYQQEDDAVQDYQRRLTKNTRNMIAVNEQWLNDLAAIDPPQRAACEQVIHRQLTARRFELGVEAPRFAARLRAYVRAARDGVPLGPTTRQFAKRAIAPVYRWWIRRNAERLCRRLG